MAPEYRPLPQQGVVWVVQDGLEELSLAIVSRLKQLGVAAESVALSHFDRQDALNIKGLQGLYFLVQGEDHHHERLSQAYQLLAFALPALDRNAGFLATICQRPGSFLAGGIESIHEIYASCLGSLPKTVSREWPSIHARALNLIEEFTSLGEAALRIVDASMLRGPVEIAVKKSGYQRLVLIEERFNDSSEMNILNRSDTILVTGGARGVTAATLLSLAKDQPARFVIWGRSQLHAPEGPTTTHLNDAGSLKKELLRLDPQLKHPRDLEKAYRNLLSQRELEATFSALRNLGSEVIYESVDVSQDLELRGAFDRLRQRYPQIKAVIHGAGVIRDKVIVDQNSSELLEVLDTKLLILPYLEKLAMEGTSWMVFFSSSTARLGRKGQGAYGLANEALNLASVFLNKTYGCRVLSMNWGPWNGGMVNDSLKKLFESEGLGTIPLQEGADLQTYLIRRPQLGSGQWLVLGEGGKEIVKSHIAEGISSLRMVNIKTTPVILDHVLKSRAVVPAALILEWMVDAAREEIPHLSLAAITDFVVWKGIVLDRHSQIELCVKLNRIGDTSMECVLRSLGSKGELLQHARAVLKFSSVPQSLELNKVPRAQDPQFKLLQPYESLLFHGPSLQYIDKVLSNSIETLTVALTLHGESLAWNLEHGVFEAQAPLLDAVFQAAIVWLGLNHDGRGLPSRFASVQYYRPWTKGKALLEMQIIHADEKTVKADALVWNEKGELIARIQGFEATRAASLNEAFNERQLRTSV